MTVVCIVSFISLAPFRQSYHSLKDKQQLQWQSTCQPALSLKLQVDVYHWTSLTMLIPSYIFSISCSASYCVHTGVNSMPYGALTDINSMHHVVHTGVHSMLHVVCTQVHSLPNTTWPTWHCLRRRWWPTTCVGWNLSPWTPCSADSPNCRNGEPHCTAALLYVANDVLRYWEAVSLATQQLCFTLQMIQWILITYYCTQFALHCIVTTHSLLYTADDSLGIDKLLLHTVCFTLQMILLILINCFCMQFALHCRWFSWYW